LQTPFALPIALAHDDPAQQSASPVHVSPAAPHACAQMYGGVPLGLGTHGSPLQQLALDAHEPLVGTHVTPLHLGMPMPSGWHVAAPPPAQLPLQQSHVALHDIDESLQTSPSGLQPIGALHVPIVFGAVMTHVTGVAGLPGRPAEPQQSPSFAQKSPTG
jgi:hypothetical protein